MKFYLTIFFSFHFLYGISQVEDHFDDGDFTQSPAWAGDGSDFYVNSYGQLQLNATTAGNSQLFVPLNLSTLDSCEWRFFIRMNFSPSSSNYTRYYLSSDQANLKMPLNGYFLQFGEALSDDAIELYRQEGTSVTSVCRGQNGRIANAFSAEVKVFRSPLGVWTISTDYQGGMNYAVEATGTDTASFVPGFIGVNCMYTSGNINKFYFDNVYAGPVIPDTIRPYITSYKVVRDSSLAISFSEHIESGSLQQIQNYSISPFVGYPSGILPDSADELTAILIFADHFTSGNTYSLSISGLTDLSNNSLISSAIEFTFYPISTAQKDDIIFTEVYYETSTTSPLPYAEYIEIYNRSDSAVDLSNWTITDGSSDGKLSNFVIPPLTYALLVNGEDALLFTNISNILSVDGLPALNNDVGDHITLLNEQGEVISELVFNDDFYQDNNRKNGGWSIERIDNSFTCPNKDNWKACTAAKQGTPGSGNSNTGFFTDIDRPYVLSAFLPDSNAVRVIFSEPVSLASSGNTGFIVQTESGSSVSPVSVLLNPGKDSVLLSFADDFLPGIYSLILSDNVSDCPGNIVDQSQLVQFGFPEKSQKGDVILNEILFDPYDGGVDFIELYNRSGKIIDLKRWMVSEAEWSDNNLIKENALIANEHLLLLPGKYLVLTSNKELVQKYYSCENKFVFHKVIDFPDFNSDKGRALIKDDEGNTMEDFAYESEMHFPLITNSKGVSLEKLDANGPGERNNWHSAAATAGFATPGYRNSHQIGLGSGENEVSMGGEIFSPNGDGYHDVMSIHYKFMQAGTVLSLIVFDSGGNPVRTLVNRETTGNEGVVYWDGLREDNSIASTGIYILLASSFDLAGNSKVVKKAFFLNGNM